MSEVSSDVSGTAISSTDKQRRGIKLTLFFIIAFISLVLAGFYNKITSPRQLSDIELQINGAFVFDKPRIFKDFSLVDQDGKAFTLENLQGKWSLVFFGYASCPDVCPATLALLRDMKGKLDEEFAQQLQITMVTVDPKRDTVEKLKPYVGYFGEEFVGVTGQFLDIKHFANQLNMAFVKVPYSGDPKDEAAVAQYKENYLVDHSANIALINPYGHYHGFLKPPLAEDRMRLTLKSIMSTFDG